MNLQTGPTAWLGHWFGLLCVVWIGVGCASFTDQTKAIRAAAHTGQYELALEELEKAKLKDGSSHLLYLLNRAVIMDRLGKSVQSRRLFEQATRYADKLYTTSLSKEAATYLINESIQDYPGEDYERVAIHVLMALSFLGQQKLESAGVEARRINQKLKEFNDSYEEKKNSYAEDGMARYLAGTIFEARGDLGPALIEYRRSFKLFGGSFSNFSTDGVPDQLFAALVRVATQLGRNDVLQELRKSEGVDRVASIKTIRRGYGELIVLHELGKIPVKRTSELVFTVGSQIVRASFPVIPRYYKLDNGPTGVERQGAGLVDSENFADFGKIARQTLEDSSGRVILKSGTRLLVKGQVAEQARQNYGELAGLVTSIFNAVTETADTRSWNLLPLRIHATRLQLPKGKHTVTLVTDGERKTVQVEVKAGKIQFLRHFSSSPGHRPIRTRGSW